MKQQQQGARMKTKMAEGSEYFTIGSIVSCKTCFDKKYEGEVVAFDPHTKLLILKCPATNGKPNIHDVNLLNLSLVDEIEVKKEASNSPPVLQNLNLPRLSTRLKHQTDEKMRLIKAMADGVTPEGQQLFLTITKTIEEVMWQGSNIVVMNQVIITPPYRPENCKGKTKDCQALVHVRKIVEKHIKDQQGPDQQPTVVGNSSSTQPSLSTQQQPPQA